MAQNTGKKTIGAAVAEVLGWMSEECYLLQSLGGLVVENTQFSSD